MALKETMSKVKTTASESVATRCTIGETGSQNAEASDLAAAVSTRQHMVSGGDDCRCAFCYLSGDSEVSCKPRPINPGQLSSKFKTAYSILGLQLRMCSVMSRPVIILEFHPCNGNQKID